MNGANETSVGYIVFRWNENDSNEKQKFRLSASSSRSQIYLIVLVPIIRLRKAVGVS